ncbi:BBP7 family outer membrane beta-barrel protein [Roseiconus lacunae]|uniref:BBP7 family outer membrane beta-barrel protein n=1 Tax=Roseiconus lacunae TaxID=2605694 RepID=UPI001E59156A|nr:BBP7 family outer membrane beta-barrel protein [Roseiconus lacunae]MCD0460670.1 BBP7 family outer membrane beta-barrel protein [Roseiconus lacunae]
MTASIAILPHSCVLAADDQWDVGAEYLGGWIEGAKAPSLVTASSPGTSRANAGVVGLPATEVLLGDEEIGDDFRSGMRLTLSKRLDQSLSFFGSGFFLSESQSRSAYGGDDTGSPILSRPFIDGQTGLNNAELVSFPNVLSGAVTVAYESDVAGAQFGVRRVMPDPSGLISVSVGYRYLQLTDSIAIREDLESIDLGGVVPLGTEFVVRDEFNTKNQFHGANFGLHIERQLLGCDIRFSPSVAFGGLRRTAKVNGDTTVTIPTVTPTITQGGLLSQPTNIGTYTSTDFTVVPEFRTQIDRSLFSGCELVFGYSFTLIPNAYRAPSLIDLNVNQSQIGGGSLIGQAVPRFNDAVDHTWIQTLSWGVVILR